MRFIKILKKIKRKFVSLKFRLIGPFNRRGLKNFNFSIISNNCWGGVVYRKLGIKYSTPTCGLFFFSDDYLKFVSKLSLYLNSDLIQINYNDSKYIDELTAMNINSDTVIGKLIDIEIIFLHYNSFSEAKKKWDKRKNRVNYDDLLIKFSDQNCFKYKNFEEFDKLPYKHKLFITTNKSIVSNHNTQIIYIDDNYNVGYAKDDIEPSFAKIDLINLLNSLD